MEYIKGKLALVAKTGGIRLEGHDNWFNPTKGAKESVLQSMEIISEWKGIEVVLHMTEDGLFERMQKSEYFQPDKIKDDDCKKVEVVSHPATPPTEPDRRNKTPIQMQSTENYFKLLSKIEARKKKNFGKLSYISWAESWELLKSVYPDAYYYVYENNNGLPYFADITGGMVKVGVTINNVEHIVWLAIQTIGTQKHTPIKPDNITSADINNTIQRALAKAIAMHGIGLYVYQGEDFPKKEVA